MTRLLTLAASASLVLVAQAASAQELRPIENYSLHLGGVSGSVYFENVNANAHLVATLSSGEAAAPVRFVTNLSSGQSAVVSVPRGLGEPALEVTFTRLGDHVVVADSDTVVGSIK